MTSLRKDANSIFRAALKAADPVEAVQNFLIRYGDTVLAGKKRYDLRHFEKVLVLGAGKAAAAMARATEYVLGKRITGGLVVTKYGHGAPLERIELHESGHPVPDERGVDGARYLAKLAAGASEKDLVIVLISGGASALTPAPIPPITLAEKQETTRRLLACGANINEINAVRKHISAIKGGQLARLASPATLVTLMLSDVIGDPLDVIGSGPTVPDPSTFADAYAILSRYQLLQQIPASVRKHIDDGLTGRIPETPKEGDPAFARAQNMVVGSNRIAVDAAAAQARTLGYKTMVLSTFIEGETRDVARVHAAIVREIRAARRPLKPPACIISGGETTVTVRGDGMGGRNQEFVLAAALDLAGMEDVVVFSGGTDGTDGPTDAAGAVADGRTVERGLAAGMAARDALERNDSYHFFERLGDLVKTGPTRTNVNDVRILLVK